MHAQEHSKHTCPAARQALTLDEAAGLTPPHYLLDQAHGSISADPNLPLCGALLRSLCFFCEPTALLPRQPSRAGLHYCYGTCGAQTFFERQTHAVRYLVLTDGRTHQHHMARFMHVCRDPVLPGSLVKCQGRTCPDRQLRAARNTRPVRFDRAPRPGTCIECEMSQAGEILCFCPR